MKEKYIRLTAIQDIVNRLWQEAANQWELDDMTICRRILEELEQVEDGDYVELPTTKEDKLRCMSMEDAMQS